MLLYCTFPFHFLVAVDPSPLMCTYFCYYLHSLHGQLLLLLALFAWTTFVITCILCMDNFCYYLHSLHGQLLLLLAFFAWTTFVNTCILCMDNFCYYLHSLNGQLLFLLAFFAWTTFGHVTAIFQCWFQFIVFLLLYSMYPYEFSDYLLVIHQ